MNTIAIVGAGFSGAMLALHLLQRCPGNARVYLIEGSHQFGCGLAYSTGNPNHRLNVPAGRMSAFQNQPRHFLDWLQRQSSFAHPGGIDETAFVPRRVFGAYIRDLLNAELERLDGVDRLVLVRGEAVAMHRTAAGWMIGLDCGGVLYVDLAVLAVGNFPPESPWIPNPTFYETPYYRSDPWVTDALSELDPAASVLLIGTGLTMVDSVLSLLDQGHAGTIYALSRHGLLSREYNAFEGNWPDFLPNPLPGSVLGLTRLVRAEIQRAVDQGAGWQAVFNTLRPLVQALWQVLPQPERTRFLRHLRPWWDVHRHRLAPEVARRIEASRRSGQLLIKAGRIRGFRIDGGEAVAEFIPRGARTIESLRVRRVINCSGPACDYARLKHPLVRSLLEQGTIRPDPLHLGLDVTPNGAVVDRSGRPSQRLYAVGPVTKGMFWEIIAVPDIRRQCEALAVHLGSQMRARLDGDAA